MGCTCGGPRGPPSLPPVLGGPTYPGGWASRPRKEEQLEMALGRRGGEEAHLWGERGLSRGGGTVPSLGERAVAVRGVPTTHSLPQGSPPEEEGRRGLPAEGGGGVGGPQDPLFGCSPEQRLCGRGEFPGPRSGRPASVYRPARPQAEVRWESQMDSRSCSPGRRLRIPRPRALGSASPTPFSFRSPGLPPSCWLPASPPPSLRHAGLPSAPLLPSRHASSVSPSPPPQTLDF